MENISLMIENLRVANQESLKWSKIMKVLSNPMLENLDHIPLMYRWFCESVNEKMPEGGEIDNKQTRQFLFIILRFYSPTTLINKPMVRGLRKKLTEILGLQAVTAISNRKSNATFFYDNYKGDRESINRLYQVIYECLIKEGILFPPANP